MDDSTLLINVPCRTGRGSIKAFLPRNPSTFPGKYFSGAKKRANILSFYEFFSFSPAKFAYMILIIKIIYHSANFTRASKE